MKILYLSKNISNYKSANYQKEFIDHLSKYSKIFLFGPGYKSFDKKKTIDEIINKFGPFDCIFVGHAWLSDNEKKNIDPWPKSNIFKNKVKKFFFLNKEYVNLKNKLDWIKKNNFEIVFSHYQNCRKWSKDLNTRFVFLPFAYNDRLFFNSKKKRKFDITFSGVLQNSHGDKVQSDLRVKIMNLFFHTFLDIPLFKKKKYRHLNIFWNSVPRSKIGIIISRLFGFYKFIDIKEYAKIQRDTKIYINCKSPLNLISPRYFENVASGCLVLTEKNNEIKKFLPKNSYKEFLSDLSNFEEVLKKIFYIYKPGKKKNNHFSKKINKKHTWNNRAKTTLKLVKQSIK